MHIDICKHTYVCTSTHKIHTHTQTHTDGRAAREHTYRHGGTLTGKCKHGHTLGTPGATRAAAVTTATFFTTAS